MRRPYQQPGLTLRNGPTDAALTVALQSDLRRLGYLAGGLDGEFGDGTERALRALQYDLLNDGPVDPDVPPTVSIRSFNRDSQGNPRVAQVTGVLDQALATCIEAMLDSPTFTQVPRSDTPADVNRAALDAVAAISSPVAPPPFMRAIFMQESGARHFCVPSAGNADDFVVVGLDRNEPANPDRITSRGYGVGQYTFFHHPLYPDEIARHVLDPVANVHGAFDELRDKFDHFIAGNTTHTTADDREAEHPHLPLRECMYKRSDPRFMRDCANCARKASTVDIDEATPYFIGSAGLFHADQYYKSAVYRGVPQRADFLCDWPYAVRRYNGSGNDSYHYQARVLLNLVALPPLPGA